MNSVKCKVVNHSQTSSTAGQLIVAGVNRFCPLLGCSVILRSIQFYHRAAARIFGMFSDVCMSEPSSQDGAFSEDDRSTLDKDYSPGSLVESSSQESGGKTSSIKKQLIVNVASFRRHV